MRKKGLQAKPENSDLQDGKGDEGDKTRGERSRWGSAKKVDQAKKAPATDEEGEDGLGPREISSQDVSESKQEEPDENHDQKPEREKCGRGGGTPCSALAEGHKNNTGRQNLDNMAKRSATDQTDEKQTEDEAHQARGKTSIGGRDGRHGRLQVREVKIAGDSIDESGARSGDKRWKEIWRGE
jgi:hypothetical protein